MSAPLKSALAAFALLAAGPLSAQDYSVGSEAKSWNLYAEAPARFEATVVDITCEITGDCPADCGGGTRQLGLVRAADNVLVYPNKNNQPIFSGASVELQPFCGKAVEVDGLMITDPDINAQNIYLVQLIREVGATDWVKANKWSKDWEAKNPGATGKGAWYMRDPRVVADIAADGYFGLGLEKDAAILMELAE